ncbi:diguanylate cyclase/phosphodiesterase (GGDEF & EAL domains) with PAS/PAC sensor(s) [hydrothermal vent metagenome]|uniref:Diguanylate cyclase/phosphodiesterase (GGDEF & EAL domains) with PAS/PAC sensor(S) n=1 Tax=hydrothermal vent metagenome TaxID=652676 RepID=A0A3B0YH44_9ZZZZ
MLNSYRSKLIALMAAVIGLMVAVLLTSYTGARWVIQDDALTHERRTVQLYERGLEEQRIELARFAATVRDDAEVGDYAFAAISIGSGKQSLEQLLERRFPRMPVDAIMLFWGDGRVSQGSGAESIIDEVVSWPMSATNSTFYVERDEALYLVAVVPFDYQQERLAQVAVAVNLGGSWLHQQGAGLQAKLFFERDGKVFNSPDSNFYFSSFDTAGGQMMMGDELYSLSEIKLPAADGVSARLWLAQSDTAMLETLNRYNKIMVWLAVVVLAIMLITSLVAVNRFSQPIHSLITLTQQMADGQLPDLRRSRGYTEIDRLLNHFIDLIDALRNKQQEVDKVHKALIRSSITDELTGFYNRRHLADVFPKLLAQANRDSLCIAAILIDIDFFKKINDTLGHVTGDLCLKSFSDMLRSVVRASDFVFRMGGEEFLVLATGRCEQSAELLAEKIRLATENNIVNVDGKPLSVTVSLGVSSLPADMQAMPSLSELMTQADHALYAAKHAGRNCVRVYSGDEHDSGECKHQDVAQPRATEVP